MNNPYTPRREWILEYDSFTDQDLDRLKDKRMAPCSAFEHFLDYLSIWNTNFGEYYQSVLDSNPLLADYKILRGLTWVITWQSLYKELIKRRLQLVKDGFKPKEIYFQYRYAKDTCDKDRYQRNN